jgi:hypothetical protein
MAATPLRDIRTDMTREYSVRSTLCAGRQDCSDVSTWLDAVTVELSVRIVGGEQSNQEWHRPGSVVKLDRRTPRLRCFGKPAGDATDMCDAARSM